MRAVLTIVLIHDYMIRCCSCIPLLIANSTLCVLVMI